VYIVSLVGCGFNTYCNLKYSSIVLNYKIVMAKKCLSYNSICIRGDNTSSHVSYSAKVSRSYVEYYKLVVNPE